VYFLFHYCTSVFLMELPFPIYASVTLFFASKKLPSIHPSPPFLLPPSHPPVGLMGSCLFN
jgi:hypothetical protein